METRQVRESDNEARPATVGVKSEPVEDERPRVIDKRRFQRLLSEDWTTVEPIPETPRYPSYVEELQAKLAASEERLLAYAEQVRQARQQMQTEVEAIRDRLRRQVAEQVDQSKAQLIGSLLEVLDNLNRAIQAAEATPSFEGLLAGIKATAALFERSLAAQGVSVIDPRGEPFDPHLHEAVESVTVEPERDGLVIEVLRPGYKLGEATLIRPARVRVGKADSTQDHHAPPEDRAS